MRLVIAEKPDMGRRYAAVLGAAERHEGWLEGSDAIVSWAFGHLLAEAMPQEYPEWPDAAKGDFAALPYIPAQWRYLPRGDAGAKKQLKVLCALLGREDVTEVVNACDPDREGELIFWRIYEHAGCDKPVSRLWSTSLEEEAMARDLGHLRPASEFAGLADAARGRACADWLLGINGTRAYTTLYRRRKGGPLSVGRVKTCVLAEVADRCRRHDAFKPMPFWRCALTFDGFAAEGPQCEAAEEAEAQKARAERAGTAAVTSAERKAKRVAAPKLYDLTELQRDASTVCGMGADETLAAAQSCYEKAILTYPRTPSRYIGSDTVAEAEDVLRSLVEGGVLDTSLTHAFDASRADVSRIVKDDAVQGHPALMPTPTFARRGFEGLSDAERAVMTLVCARLLCAVMGPAAMTVTKLGLSVGDDAYTATGSVVTDGSWRAVDAAARRLLKGSAEKGEGGGQEIPPGIQEGDALPISCVEVKEGKTSPPRLYTEAELLGFMKNPSRKIQDEQLKEAICDDSSHSAGIGTPATRDAILKELFSKKLLKKKGRSVIATDEGIALIDVIGDSPLTRPELTATWELELSRVQEGERDLPRFLQDIEGFTREVVAGAKASYDPERAKAFGADVSVGECPVCHAPVLLKERSIQCSTNRFAKAEDGTWSRTEGCGFSLARTVAGKLLTEEQARALLTGKTVAAKGLKGKRGPFDAGLRLKGDGSGIEFVFDKKGPKGSKRPRAK